MFERPFDPGDAAAPDSGIFGLTASPEQAGVHVVGVPFDATTSYRKGAAHGPDAVLAASRQVDLYDLLTGRPYEAGIWMAPLDERVVDWNEEAGELAQRVIDVGGRIEGDPGLAADLARVDEISALLNRWVHEETAGRLEQGKLVGILGGDHSVPFGAIEAIAERHPGLGILHFDAHADLREAYEGFTWSHASIFHNVATRLDGVARIVQVGIRDLSEAEHDFIRASEGRVQAVFDPDWAAARATPGGTLELVRRALAPLPREVYVSFDVDGLDPALCPNTGTPVPGGLSFADAMLWLGELVASGRRVVGFDLNEVAPGGERGPGEGWDEIVGARLLYRLIGFALRSRAAG